MSDTSSYKLSLKKLESKKEKNIFIIMRYGSGKQYKELEKTIKFSLNKYGFNAIFARDENVDPVLFENVKHCIHNSRNCIVVIEDIDRNPTHNPNVFFELGYIIAQKKPFLLLKEKALSSIPTDAYGLVYKEFDSHNIEGTISIALKEWIEKSIHPMLTRRAIIISSNNQIESLKKRTLKLIDEYEDVLRTKCQEPIRLAGIMSSLAVSNKSHYRGDEHNELNPLFLKEKELLLNIIESGVKVKCIVAPKIYLQRVSDDPKLIEEAKSNYIHRYSTLLDEIRNLYKNENFEIVWSEQLPRNGLIICGNSTVFIDSRTAHEHKTRTRIIYDTELIKHEIGGGPQNLDNVLSSKSS